MRAAGHGPHPQMAFEISGTGFECRGTNHKMVNFGHYFSP
jgi:hypothetical protein